MELNQVTLPVADIPRSIAFFRRLGFKQIVDAPHYAKFECSPGGASFSVHLTDERRSGAGVVIYFECEDVDAEVQRLLGEGVEVDDGPIDQSWLWREAHLSDPDGNRICLYHAGEARLNPPWRLG